VQDLVVGLLKRFQASEMEVDHLREQVNRNSGNSSQPPSRMARRGQAYRSREESERADPRWQAGHPGTQRKLVAVEELKAEYDIKPTNCRRCGGVLSGEDPSPDRHQVAEIPPAKVEVTEYRLHTLNCPICGAENPRPKLPEGVPTGRLWSTFTGDGQPTEWKGTT